MRLNYFDYFRAISILLIVAGHSYGPWNIDTFPEKIVANLITGGTALFVFISGFFFHHVFFPRFKFADFFKKKFKNVFFPYIILSSAAFFIIVVFFNHPSEWVYGDLNGFTNSVILYLKYFWTGRVLLAYWYIPFIMIIFAISPLFIKYIYLSEKQRIVILIIHLIISMLIHRPLHNLSPFHSVIYFIPFYMLGIIFSINQKRISDFIYNKTISLGVLTLLASAIQVLMYGFYGNFHKKVMVSYNGFDILIIQKILMIFFFLSLLQKIDKLEIPFLKYIASVSFALFFLHPWALLSLSFVSFASYISFLPGALIFPINTLVAIGISLAAAALLKTLFREKSRYIIGW